MRKNLFIVLTISMLAVFSSCATTTHCEPKTSDDTLLVGRIAINISGLKSSAGSLLNGVKHGNMEITFQDVSDQKIYYLTTDKNGLFMTNKIKKGHSYKILSYSYNKNYSQGNWALIDFPLIYTTRPIMETGNIYVFCNIVIDAKASGENSLSCSYYNDVDKYDEIIDLLKENYSGSDWCSYPVADYDIF